MMEAHFEFAAPEEMELKDLRRDKDGFWQATLVLGGEELPVDRRHGSWQTVGPKTRKHLLPEVAAHIQEQVRSLELAEARRKGKEEKDGPE